MTEKPRTLNLPSVARVVFPRNYVRLAVCQLRFPTFLELRDHPPVEFQKRIRKTFPVYEAVADAGYMFATQDRSWSVTLDVASIALESNRYTTFDDFRGRLEPVVEAAVPVVDAPFFTRIGLRYINRFPIEMAEISEWLNKDLVAPMSHGPWGDLEKQLQEFVGVGRAGRFIFRQGLLPGDGSKREVVLDLDFYAESIEVERWKTVVADLHDDAYRLFRWALGPKAEAALGSGNADEGGAR